ncbi:restriction endonuclease [Sphingomonas sp.]|uniref:restriction endonuclease n=1 Tax=Sphingomonas sp. TaxID=28214 RepID=UPI0025E0A5E4|nr:restriction endonuclease [Sphingomonas sp.]
MSVTLPRHEDLMLPTLKVLDELGGSGSNDEINDAVIAGQGFSQAQLDVVYEKSGAPVLVDRLSWARSYLKMPGFLASAGRGVWVLTDAGREALSLNADQLRKKVNEAYRRLNAERQKKSAIDNAEAHKAEDEADWSDRLLAKLKSIEPAAFERLAQRLLRESGFVKVEVTGKAGDGGIDGVGVLRMNLISFQVLFQCKRYAGSVSAGTVRDFRGAMQGRADKGLIITTGTFTTDAKREATRDGAPAIDLVDGELLCQLLKERGLGVTVRQVVVEEVDIDAGFFDGL